MDVSIVIPVNNERENIPLLHEQLGRVMADLGRTCEVVIVEDGSTDGSLERLQELAQTDDCIKVVRFRRNFGQTAAMQAGIHFASGDVIVTMDGDLQNDPLDIQMMLNKIDEGYDLVHGWRKDRQDPWLNRRLPSQLANRLISRVTGFPIHDLGCTLKAVRREIACELELYGEMHRFIPLLLLTAFSMMAAIQFFSLGLLGEVNARIYFGSQHKQHYAVRELLNFGDATEDRAVLRPQRAA